jgi:hypothetical protein
VLGAALGTQASTLGPTHGAMAGPLGYDAYRRALGAPTLVLRTALGTQASTLGPTHGAMGPAVGAGMCEVPLPGTLAMGGDPRRATVTGCAYPGRQEQQGCEQNDQVSFGVGLIRAHVSLRHMGSDAPL